MDQRHATLPFRHRALLRKISDILYVLEENMQIISWTCALRHCALPCLPAYNIIEAYLL